MRWSVGAVVLVVALAMASAALGAPGDFDTSFGSLGYQTVGFGAMDRATHAAVTPDGRIVMVGTTNAGGSNDWAITRLKADGTDDLSFSGDAQTILGTTAGADDIGAGIVVLADERMVVSGQGNASKDFVAKRLNVDGSVDGSFAGGAGAATVDFGGDDPVNAMIAQPDGKLVLVGSTSASGGGDFAIARLNADGTADTGFSGDGRQSVDLGGADAAIAVANAPGGRLVVVGQGGAGTDMAVVRLNADGSPDTSFGSGGKATVDFGTTEAANGVVVGADGSIVIDGLRGSSEAGSFAVAKLSPNGALDPAFSGDGKLTLSFGGTNESALALALQQNGKLVVMGTGRTGHDFIVARLLPDGSADAGFGTAGTMTVDFGKYEYDGDVVLQPDGRILVAGSTNVQDDGDMAIARLQGDASGGGPATPPGGTPGGGGGGGGGAGGAAPTASFVPGASLKLPGATRFSAADSLPSPGAKLISVKWSITGQGLTFDTDCGTSPATSVLLKKPGNYNVRLTVLDSLGRTATSQRFVPVTRLGAKKSVKGDGVFTCENPAQGNQPSRADCVKSFGAGILDINSRSSKDECFTIDTKGEGSSKVARGIIRGPVAINGLYVPIPGSVRSAYLSDGTVGIEGKEQISVRVGPFLTQKISLEKRVVPNKFLIYHLVDVDLSTNTPKFLGALPVRGAFAIDLAYHKSYVKVGIGLPSPLSFGAKRTAQGDVKMISDNVNGLHYDGLSIKVPDVWLGPLFVNNLGFSYQKSTNTWGGTAKVTLPGSRIALNASGPPEQPPDFGFGIKNGKFDHAGFGIDFLPPTQPDLFPPFNTVLLSHIGAAVGINPLRLTGTIGLNAAHIVEEDGVLFGAFATSSTPYTLPESVGPELAPLASRTFDRFSLAIGGTAKLKVPILGDLPLLNAYGLYEYPDYFEFGGGFSFGISYLSIDGNVGGFAFPTKRAFNVQGGLKACLRNIKIGYKFVKVSVSPCLNVGAVVSSRGIGFCGVIPIPFPVFGTIPITVGAGYKWGDRTPDLMIFSCDYAPYAEKSPLARSAQAGGAYAVNVPAGLPSVMFRVRGSGGVPDVTVTDPKGTDVLGTPDAVSFEGTDPDTVLVGVRKPAAGRWTFTPKGGSPAVAGVAVANGLPPAALKARVTKGKGGRRVLRYRMNAATGRSVTFVERGPATSRVLGETARGAGTITFTPGPGRSGRRSIVALVSQSGAPAREQAVATYTAPRPAAPARPGRVRARRSGGKIRIIWSAARGASRYEVLVRLSDHSQVFRVVRGRRLTVDDPLATKRGTVSVNALTSDARRSASRTARLAPRRASRRR